jgi:DNA-binding NarL/FixJ family response regulator
MSAVQPGKLNQPEKVPSGGDARRQPAHVKRAMLADFCRVWGDRLTGAGEAAPPAQPPSPEQGVPTPAMGPRLRQTLGLLLQGEGEKQIAAKLKLSPHTVHGYVKEVYRRFDVCSRAELLALWVKR